MTIQYTQADLDRFMRFVVKLPGRLLLPDGRQLSACWPWLGARSRGHGNRHWYGSFWVGKRTVRAHRFSCVVFKGFDCPADHDRDHLCQFSLCVNPEHIEYVPKATNGALRWLRAQRGSPDATQA